MRVFLVNESNPIAMSLVNKINNAENGTIVKVTAEEWKFAKHGGLLPIEIPEDSIGRKLTVTGGSLPQTGEVKSGAKSGPDKPSPSTVGQKPPGTSPKSQVA